MSEPDEVSTECKCEMAVMAQRKFRNGSLHIGHWCQNCGSWSNATKDEALGVDIRTLPVWTEEPKEQWEQFCREQWDKSRKRRETHQHRLYDAYMQTPRWAAKRAAVLKRDPTCKACGVAPSVQAHHLTYDRVGDEPLFDLVGVCAACHQRIHQHDQDLCICKECRPAE